MKRCVILLLWASLTACAPFYSAVPLQTQNNVQIIEALTPNEQGFKQFARKQSPNVALPIERWDLNSLTLSALYFHPALKVAKSEYAVALAGIESAGLRPNIGFNTNLDKSNQANGDINPWAYGLQVDIPIITANKRQISIEVAQHQAEIAKIAVAETAWSLRYQLSVDLVNRTEIQVQRQHLTQLQNAYQALLHTFEKRLKAGIAGNSDVLQIRLQLDQVTVQLQQSALQLQQTEQKIVHDAGLVDRTIKMAHISDLSLNTLIQVVVPNTSPLTPNKWIQHQALTNRMDIQRGLAQYAKAESQLKLQIAKRYPDLSLSPGILYEYGDRIWALSIGGMLNLLNRSSALWAQAAQVRDQEAKRFYALQQHIIQQSEQAYLNYQQSVSMLDSLKTSLQRQQDRRMQLEQQWRKGLIDKSEWLQAQIQYETANQRVSMQQVSVVRALLEIENVMQRPFLFSTPLPARIALTDTK